jgi:NAD(P)-dependent dehydrogenase (short-subunit alcohol dehydrogenase family)
VPGWTPIVLDVTSEQSVGDAIARILERDGRIDALVHCAGMSVAGAVEDVTIAEAEHQFSTNYFGSLRVIRAVLPDMRRRRNGRILVIGSIGGLIGLPLTAVHSPLLGVEVCARRIDRGVAT